jgi:phage terminase large subunit-like protein
MDGAWEIWNFTPWVPNDVYAHIKKTGEYLVSKTPVMIPAREGEPGASYWEPTPINPDHPEIGSIKYSGKWWKLYWPDVWGFDRIAKYYRKNLEDSGDLGFARMMLLDLKAAEGLNLKAEWLHEYPASEIGASWPVFFGIDYASTADKLKSKERDYFALAILRAIPGGGLVLVDGKRAKISKGEALETAMGYWGIYPTLRQMGVENIGKGEEFYNDLMLMTDAIGRVPPLLPVTHGRRSKGERFEKWLGPRFQMARIWISDQSTPFLRAFRNEWLNWPNTPHDDCLDAVYMGAVAAEGFMPTRAQRSFRKAKQTNPFVSLGRR